MAEDPFEVLARAVDRKSNLALTQVKVTAVESSGRLAVTLRGATVHEVPFTGATTPSVGDLLWVLIDDGVILGLA